MIPFLRVGFRLACQDHQLDVDRLGPLRPERDHVARSSDAILDRLRGPRIRQDAAGATGILDEDLVVVGEKLQLHGRHCTSPRVRLGGQLSQPGASVSPAALDTRART